MRRAERPTRGEVALAAEAAHAVDPRHLERLVARRAAAGSTAAAARASSCREPGGPHSSRWWRARGGDRQRLDRRGMAAHVAEIGRRHASAACAPRTAAGADLAAQRRREPGEVRDAEHLEPVDERRLARRARAARRARPARAGRAPSAATSVPGRRGPRRSATARRRPRGARARRSGSRPRRRGSRRRSRGRSRRRPCAGGPGARLTVIRRCGNSKPELRIAALTRSRDSATDAVAEPDDGERRKPAAQVGLDDDGPGVESVEREGGDAGEHERRR